ncbi:MAG: alpha/beta fold hydrolase [Gaiellaceae bacterium]
MSRAVLLAAVRGRRPIMSDTLDQMLHRRRFDTGELALSCLEGGQGRDPLLLVHGLTGSAANWQALAPHLLSDWHLLVPELRGHGGSDRPERGYRLDDYSRNFRAFLEHEIAGPAVVVGHSLGAWVTLALAPSVPHLLRAVCLLDPPLVHRTLKLEAVPAQQAWLSFVRDAGRASRSRAELVAACRAYRPDADEQAVAELADQVASVSPDAVEAVLDEQLVAGFDFEAAFRGIRCSALLLRGDWQSGSLVREQDARLARAWCPQLVDVRIPGAGHLVDREPIELVVAHLQAFLGTV